MTTRTNQRDNNMVANFHRGDTFSNSFDYSCAFVAIDRWQRATPMSVCVGDVAVANSNCRKLYFHFTRTSICKRHFFNDEWLSKFATNGCFHDS